MFIYYVGLPPLPPHTRMHTHACMYTHTHTHTHTHTRTHTHTQHTNTLTTHMHAYIHCSSQPYHMSAAALNAFHSLLLKQVTGNHFLSIIAYNHPLPRNITAQVNILGGGRNVHPKGENSMVVPGLDI